MRCYLLEQNGEPIAFVLGIQWNGDFVYEELGYDPVFAAQSPGTVLLFHIVNDLIARNTPVRLNFGFGDAEYKRLFGNSQMTSASSLILRQSIRPALVIALNRAWGATRRYAKSVVSALGMKSTLKKVLRHRI
jgi:CelD/BcsL family acetyltransferase involved in cellulose biosynthesis